MPAFQKSFCQQSDLHSCSVTAGAAPAACQVARWGLWAEAAPETVDISETCVPTCREPQEESTTACLSSSQCLDTYPGAGQEGGTRHSRCQAQEGIHPPWQAATGDAAGCHLTAAGVAAWAWKDAALIGRPLQAHLVCRAACRWA